MLAFLALALMSLPSPDSILKAADAFRSPQGGFETSVDVVDKDGATSKFVVYIEGNEKSLIVTKAPARDVGRNMLMLDRDMWMFMPSVNRAVRIALRQRLMGQVAQGDISRMKWFGDYKAEILNDGKVEKKNGQEAIKLDLRAARENLTYDRISLWVSPKDFRPFVAEFQTAQGKVLKTAEFENYGPLAGATRARTIKITDALKPSEKSSILLQEMKQAKFPTGFFSQNNLQSPRR